MEKRVITFIQDQIGYNFKNIDLLRQAFVRRSYSEENGGQNNEVLEFIGDKVLDLSVVRLLSRKYGHMANGTPFDEPKTSVVFLDQFFSPIQQNSSTDSSPNEFICDYDEGVLSSLKSKLVNKKTLANRIDDLGLADYLIMGEGDIQNSVAQRDSVKEDLFEAILGAVALDCKWNLDELLDIVEIMLAPELHLENDDKNYVDLIQKWTHWKQNKIPLYHFIKGSYQLSWYTTFDGISQHFSPLEMRKQEEIQFHCHLNIQDLPGFRGFGRSKAEARMAVCKVAYEYLEKENLLFSIRDEIDNPNKEDAISQLEILVRRGYFSLPVYNFNVQHDNNGNPIWECQCCIAECDSSFSSKSSSKKDAKKSAAFEMLSHVLKESTNFNIQS